MVDGVVISAAMSYVSDMKCEIFSTKIFFGIFFYKKCERVAKNSMDNHVKVFRLSNTKHFLFQGKVNSISQ